MQKTKINVLSTRPLSRQLVEEAANNDIVIDELSFIETKIVDDEKIAVIIEQYLQQDIIAVFTSMNAVEAVARHKNRPPRWKIYCIGNTTETLVEDYFGKGIIGGTANSAGELGDVIIKDKIEAVIFFCGDLRREELPEKLKQHGVIINELVVYNTTETPVKVNKRYNGILFFSPSTVQSFFSVNEVDQETQLFAIGSTTAKAIQQYNKSNVVISGSPGKENMVRMMMEYYHN